MAKRKSTKKQKSIEETLWDSANKLRGSVEPSEYKHVVLSLIFLKFVSDKFEVQQQKIIDAGREKYLDNKAFYRRDNVFYLSPKSRWKYIKEQSKQNDIALKIDTALSLIEKDNKALEGALPDNYYSRLGLDKSKLSSLIDTINNINTLQNGQQDLIGKIYMYFLKKFALAEGKGKGEFYTPDSIVQLIAELIEPYSGKIYDPCCGSGGMFVQSFDFIEAHKGNRKNVSVYGQEYTNTTYKLAKMNLAIRGISAKLGKRAANTFLNDQHPDLKADYIMANPPFNQKDWKDDDLDDDPRWEGYEVPPKSNANYGWILHIVSKLSDNGVAGFILANGALSGGGTEYEIRKQLIENGLVEAIVILPQSMFYTTNISVTLWIINKNRSQRTIERNGKIINYRERKKEILFLDLREMGTPFEKRFTQLTKEDIEKVADTLHTWQSADFETKYEDIPEFCYAANLKEIKKKDYSLVPSKYIEFVNRDENINFDEKMLSLKTEFTELLKAEENSKKELLNIFKELGYEIEL